MLEARHLVKRFFGTAVVSDVSFEVRPGEVVGYLGPNGSGKSTTAKMLTGLLETSGGAVLFDGQDIAHDPIAFRWSLTAWWTSRNTYQVIPARFMTTRPPQPAS